MVFAAMKRVSIYLKAGEKAATSYYRFYQFFDKIDAQFEYHLMIPDSKWNFFFPIAKQPKWKQVYIFIFIYFRVLRNLLTDLLSKPDFVVVSRCIINKVLPWSYMFLLKLIKRNGSKIIWDFDDNIIGSEMKRKNFDWFSDIADIIIVGSPFLKEMVCKQDRNKVLLLPTTDGDMHHLVTDEIKKERVKTYGEVVKFIWVGTFSTLHYVELIVDAFEKAALALKERRKELLLVVVCDKELHYTPKSFTLLNIKWEKQVAIEQMLHAHIGIMPLEDNENNRGKCGFKLIQYLSVGLPLIGSTVGVNKMIINKSLGVGITELEIDEWAEAIIRMADDLFLWQSLSQNAYQIWETHYSFESNLNKWKDIIKS